MVIVSFTCGSVAQWLAEDVGSNPMLATLLIACDVKPVGAFYSVIYAEASKRLRIWELGVP